MTMNLPTPALLSAAVIALLAGCSSTSVSSQPNARPESPASLSAPPVGPEASLEKGMTAGTVRRIMGAPSEITPMQAPSGSKAEVWIYRRTTRGNVRQVQIGFRTVPVETELLPNGQTRVMHTKEEPIFQDELEIFDETIRLLMFDDEYAEQTRSFQRRVTYQ